MSKYLSIIFLFLAFSISTTKAQNLDQNSDSLKVYIFMAEECIICQYYTLNLKELHQKYATETIEFVGLFPNKFSNRESIANFKEKYEIPFDLKTDRFKTKTKKLEVKVTPTVVIYNETKDEILYHGRIDNTYFRVGKRRRITTTSELEDALIAIKNGTPIETAKTETIGCFITF